MFQVRIHGRGGQGVVTAAEVLSVAAFLDGHWSQAFPSFGSERTGAPVVSYCRISDTEIRTREPVLAPDALIIQDPTLVHLAELFFGLGPDTFILVNTARRFDELGLARQTSTLRPGRLLTVPATELAVAHTGRPVPNTVMLGAFAALSHVVSMEAVSGAIQQRFRGAVATSNAAAAVAAFNAVASRLEECAHAPAD